GRRRGLTDASQEGLEPADDRPERRDRDRGRQEAEAGCGDRPERRRQVEAKEACPGAESRSLQLRRSASRSPSGSRNTVKSRTASFVASPTASPTRCSNSSPTSSACILTPAWIPRGPRRPSF